MAEIVNVPIGAIDANPHRLALRSQYQVKARRAVTCVVRRGINAAPSRYRDVFLKIGV